MDSPALSTLEAAFDRLVTHLGQQIQPEEQFTLRLQAEHSQFTRFNQAKVRQTGSVADGQLSLTVMRDQRSSNYTLPFTGEAAIDRPQLQQALEHLRQEVPQLPVDPFLVLPSGHNTSRERYEGDLLPAAAVAETLLPIVHGLDFAGIYAAGTLIRAYADSAGQTHWFSTNSFALDYSLFTDTEQAVKGTVAGRDWNPALYEETIANSKAQLAQMAQPPKSIAKGHYRTYLAPMAAAELLGMLSWGGVSESALQQGRSSLRDLQRGEKYLAPQFTLRENFQRGAVPRFNSLGEVAPIDLPIIAAGKLANMLVNSRTAKEYGCTANGANSSESLRSPEVSPGTIRRSEILKTLDTGLYLSNLHYLNWSDRPSGRITGMTRYACFWVENGELVAPIENLRFDDTLYRFWGDHLVGLTDFQEFVPEVGTYDNRELGGILTPGMLIDDFTYTL